MRHGNGYRRASGQAFGSGEQWIPSRGWLALVCVFIVAATALILSSIAVSDTNDSNDNGNGNGITATSDSIWQVVGDGDDAVAVDASTIFVHEKPFVSGDVRARSDGSLEQASAALWFGDGETGTRSGGVAMYHSDDGESSLSLELTDDQTTTTAADQDPNTAADGDDDDGPPPQCDRAPPIKIRKRNGECPRFFVGINNKNPQCHLHVNETLCVVGDTFINGTLFATNIVGTNVTAIQCTNDAQCDDVDPCTNDTCVNGFCVNEVPEGQCNADHQCLSNEACNTTTCMCEPTCTEETCNMFPCTVSTCRDGVCVLLHRDAGCCTQDSDCPAPINQCAKSFCQLALTGGRCAQEPDGECLHDGDCAPNEICISNCTCEPFIPSAGECLRGTECTDNCTCTLDLCNKFCECEHIPLPGCCKNDTQCDDSNPCHTNFQCDNETGLCSFDVKDDDGDQVPCDVDCDDSDDTIGTASTWFRDQDGDGDGNRAIRIVRCEAPPVFQGAWVETGTDCDDMDPNVFAGSQVCNITDLANHAKLLPDEDQRIASGENFGAGLSIHKDTIVVGSPIRNNSRGGAYIFTRAYDSFWAQQQFLEPPGNLGLAPVFGTPVTNFGDLAVVGASGANSSDGAAVIYERNVTTSIWTQVQILGPTDPGGNSSLFAIRTMDMLGERIVVGEDQFFGGRGAVHHFERNQTTGLWELQNFITDPNPGILGRFGFSVALDSADGHFLAISTNSAFNSTGRVYVYEINSTDVALFDTIEPPDPVNDIGFGHSVGLENGVLVVGAHLANVSGEAAAGTAYVFQNNGTEFVLVKKLVSPERDMIDFCGQAVAISNATIVVGCRGDRIVDSSFPTGSVHVWIRSGDTYTWGGKMFPFDIISLPSGDFGITVDISDNTIVGGSPSATVLEPSDGSAYVASCSPIRTC